MRILIKSITIENFKGILSRITYDFSQLTEIFGRNASGKTTIVDAFWWLLFNKDSQGNEKFNVRTLDADGKPIDNIEISVSAILEVDGREKELKKVQKQNWVKKRGCTERTFQGNVNVYEIDGYPKSEKEYKEYICSIISEELFKILASPSYFPGMKWQEQRDLIMCLVEEVSDVELARKNDKFSELLEELENAPSTDDIKKKYQKALTEWKKKQAELPVRIDEVEKQKVDIEVSALELLKNSLNDQIAENKVKQEDISKQFEEYDKQSKDILDLQFELNGLQQQANLELEKKRREIRMQIDDVDRQLKEIAHQIKLNNDDIGRKEGEASNNTSRISVCRIKWKNYNERLTAEKERVFDENSLVCSYCGQEYPEDKKEQLRADFESHKAEEIKRIESEMLSVTEQGNSLKAAIEKDKSEIERLKATKKENEDEEINLKESIKGLEKCLEELPDGIDISENEDAKAIKAQIAEKEQAMNKANSGAEIRRELQSECEDLQAQLDEVNSKLSLAQRNVEIDERVVELQSEQREVAQKVADQEKMLDLLEEFIRFKMDGISDSIDERLDGIKVKLFERQINGGMKECCELTYSGVPYGSLNSGHRIVAGLKIIKALQEHYGVYAPIFIDNAESINDFNVPKMDCQMILLKVSEDDGLKIKCLEG